MVTFMHQVLNRTMSSKLDTVPSVDIDESGRFKYILVKIMHDDQHKYIVRGYGRAAYHGEVDMTCISGSHES